MAAFIALKPCRFGSVDYGKGDIIPDGSVLPQRVPAMTRMGYIAPAPSPSVQEADAGGQESPQEPPAATENGEESPQGQEDAPEPAEKRPAVKGGKK